jgi:hypothetical protein
MFFHHSREGRRGWRFWWHFGASARRCVGVEAYWWSRSCHAQASVDDEGWRVSFALPPIAIYLRLENFPLWRPMKLHIFTWENNREVWLADQRECRIAVHDWKLWPVPWGKSMEWCKRDPWWVRGITIEPAKLLGRWEASHEDLAKVPVSIPMPEGLYHGVATVQRWVRGRRYWFKRRTQEVWLDIPGGIPHAGKGENAWDCGDDGLFGCGGSSINDAIQRARDSVLRDRKRYGHASDDAVRKALASATVAK